MAGAGQVLGTASLFGIRVREQPPSITGGSWHLERYIDSPHPRIESNAAGKNTNEQNRTLWSMLRPPKFIGEWVTVAGLVYCSSILGDSAPIHFPFWLQKYRRFTDVTVNSCLRLQIEFSANPGWNASTMSNVEIFSERTSVSRRSRFSDTSHCRAFQTRRSLRNPNEKECRRRTVFTVWLESTKQIETVEILRRDTEAFAWYKDTRAGCIYVSRFGRLFSSALLSFVKTCASRSRRRLPCGVFPSCLPGCAFVLPAVDLPA